MKVLMVVAQKDFRDEEFFEPRDILIKNGVEVKVASGKKDLARGRLGGTVMPDLTIDEAEVDDFSAIVLVGGRGAEVYFDDKRIHKLVKDFHNAGKIVAAICLAPVILAKADFLFGIKATCTPGEEQNLTAGGAEYTGAAVEVDGKIVTGSGPEAAREFGEKIVELLKS
jgi:protease I